MRIPLQQIGRAHDLAGLAIAALRHPLGQPSFLHGMRGIRRKPLDRGHFLAGNIRHLRLARKRALTIDMHHAGAAEADAAAKLGAGKFEFFPDHPQQRRVIGSLVSSVLTVNFQRRQDKPPTVWWRADVADRSAVRLVVPAVAVTICNRDQCTEHTRENAVETG